MLFLRFDKGKEGRRLVMAARGQNLEGRSTEISFKPAKQ